MGMGNNKNKDLYFMKIRSKTDTNQRPHFKVEKASKDGKGQPMEDVTYVNGRVKDIETGSYEWEGDTIKTFKIVLVDKEEMYYIDSSYTSLGRSILNCLANVGTDGTTPGEFRISLYTSKKGYASVWIENDGKSTGFKWPWDELKQYISVYKNKKGKEENDYAKLDEFYEAKIKEEIAPFFRDNYSEPVVTEPVDEHPPLPEPVMDEDTSDLPF